jgi:hypothetical protein
MKAMDWALGIVQRGQKTIIRQRQTRKAGKNDKRSEHLKEAGFVQYGTSSR